MLNAKEARAMAFGRCDCGKDTVYFDKAIGHLYEDEDVTKPNEGGLH